MTENLRVLGLVGLFWLSMAESGTALRTCLFVVNAETYDVMWAQFEGTFGEVISSLSFQ
jgi:hypothetical protein